MSSKGGHGSGIVARARRGTPATAGTGTLRATMWPRLVDRRRAGGRHRRRAAGPRGDRRLRPRARRCADACPATIRSIGVPSPSPSVVEPAPSAPPASGASASPRRPRRRADPPPGCSTSASRRRPSSCPRSAAATIDLANLRGKPVWVNFMGTYCPPCVDEFPLMNGFAARYADDGLVILAIDVKEEEGVVAAFAEGLGATFPLGLDGDGSAQADWDALALPVHFWIDTDGVIRDGALGRDRPGHHGPRAADDPAGRDRHAVTAAGRPPSISVRGRRRSGDRPALGGARRRSSSSPTSTGRWRSARATRPPPSSSRSRSAPCAPWRASRPSDPGGVHVAVLTGRTVADVAARVRVGGIEYLGDHGLQHGTLPRGGRAGASRGSSPTRRFDAHRDPAETLAPGVAARARVAAVAVRRAQGTVGRVPRPPGRGRRRRPGPRSSRPIAAVERARASATTAWRTIAAGRSSTSGRWTPAASARRSSGSSPRHGPGAVVVARRRAERRRRVRGGRWRPAATRRGALVGVDGGGPRRCAGRPPAELLALADLRWLAARRSGRSWRALARRGCRRSLAGRRVRCRRRARRRRSRRPPRRRSRAGSSGTGRAGWSARSRRPGRPTAGRRGAAPGASVAGSRMNM